MHSPATSTWERILDTGTQGNSLFQSAAGRGGRCYGCFRPRQDCFCAVIPRIDNQTEILILQQRRERFHPFNTARIVQKALRNSSLLADYTPQIARRLQLHPRAGLLYPGRQATLLAELPPEQRPEQLIVLDGTWHHTKTLLREIPALHNLPRFRLSPAVPSRYRIRRVPGREALSTIEATAMALRELEPQTQGLEQLLAAFDHMVERQLMRSALADSPRYCQRPARTYGNIPLALLDDRNPIVIAYAETSPGQRGRVRTLQPPIYLVAQRLATGERFAGVMRPERPFSPAFLGHLELSAEFFINGQTAAELRTSWTAFLGPSDIVAVYHPGTAAMLEQLAEGTPCLVLKSAHWDQQATGGSWETLADRLAGEIPAAEFAGRAGKRLAILGALIRRLHRLGERAPAYLRSTE